MAGYTKTIISGNVIETYSYEKAPPAQRVRRNTVRASSDSLGVRALVDRRLRNIKRTRSGFKRLVRANTRANGSPAFITLTMFEIVSVEVGSQCLNAFFKTLRREIGSSVRYIGVPEFQKRGALHYHLLVWGLPNDRVVNERRTRYIQAIWAFGYVDCIPTDGSDKLAGYMSKYMSKAMSEERLAGKRAYYYSRNVARPVFLTNTPIHHYVEEVLGVDNEVVVEREYDTLFMGRCSYQFLRLHS